MCDELLETRHVKKMSGEKLLSSLIFTVEHAHTKTNIFTETQNQKTKETLIQIYLHVNTDTEQ